MTGKSFAFSGLALAACAFVSGCCCLGPAKPVDIVAKRAISPLRIDGKLSELDWGRAIPYKLTLAREAYDNMPAAMRASFSDKLAEDGTVRVLWDDKYLYVGIEFADSDVIAEGTEDQIHHYQMGDVAEIFVKPDKDTYYWEIYVTPANFKTTFFFESRGTLGLPSGFAKDRLMKGIRTGAMVNGTLNKVRDKDHGWSAEVAIPIAEMARYGTKFAPGEPWRIFFGRYNFNRYLPGKENSSFPNQQRLNYHVLEEYGNLVLEK